MLRFRLRPLLALCAIATTLALAVTDADARAGGARYAGRRGNDPAVTGALTPRRPIPQRSRSDPDDERRQRALPLAEPGNDGADDD